MSNASTPSFVVSKTQQIEGTPTGLRFIVPSHASGAWLGQDLKIAWFDGKIWKFITPSKGSSVWVEDENISVIWSGDSWESSSAPSIPTATVGGTSSDAGKIPVLNTEGFIPTIMLPKDLGGELTGNLTVLIQSLGKVSGNITPDLALGKCITLTLSGQALLSLTSLSSMLERVYLWVSQDSTGSKYFTWGGSNIKWPGGLIPDQSISANSMDFYEFTWMGSFFVLTNFIQDCK